MNNKVKLINIVSIACRAGKVMSGEFVIEKALSSKNNIKLILLANNVAVIASVRNAHRFFVRALSIKVYKF